MLYHSNKLTEKEVKEVLDEFFLTHPTSGLIETFSNGVKRMSILNKPSIFADLRKANRKLLRGGCELFCEESNVAGYVFVYFNPSLHLESQYESV